MVAILTYSVRDDDERGEGTLSLFIPDSISLENMVGFATELAPLIDSMIRGRISRVKLAVQITLPPGAISDTASPGADLEDGCSFIFKAVGSPGGKEMRIPTFNDAFYYPSNNGGEEYADTSLPSVAAFVSAMIDGIDATPGGGNQVVAPVNSRGFGLAELEVAIHEFRKYKT